MTLKKRDGMIWPIFSSSVILDRISVARKSIDVSIELSAVTALLEQGDNARAKMEMLVAAYLFIFSSVKISYVPNDTIRDNFCPLIVLQWTMSIYIYKNRIFD